GAARARPAPRLRDARDPDAARGVRGLRPRAHRHARAPRRLREGRPDRRGARPRPQGDRARHGRLSAREGPRPGSALVIIRSIKAQGFMKYEDLELADLPKGAIAVEGENEAGKTTLGEAVAFGLFGRTVRTEETDPAQAIHWDSDKAATTIEFELLNGDGAANPELAHRQEGVYKIERTIERGGHAEARLYAPNGQLLGSTHREVARALQRVLGFSFPEFRYSFYVAQKELDLVRHATRDNTRRIIYDMLGITA